MNRIALLVNPVAGMGGRVGLKGTDGRADEALAAGARPVAPGRAAACLAAFREREARDPDLAVRWLASAGPMGLDVLRGSGVPDASIETIFTPAARTSADDTKAFAQLAVERGADLVLFAGGDGTARDVADAVAGRIPLLGIPAGVKMHSAVFALDPVVAADLLAAYVRGTLRVGDGEILDVDEEAYRAGEWKVRFYGTAKTLVEPNLVQTGKLMVAEVTEEAVLVELAEHFREMFESEPETLFLLGPGSTVSRIASRLGIEKTLLGIDAVVGMRTVGTDVNEAAILQLLDRSPRAKLVVSPIGAQGFILGRGNLQVSPEVLRRIGTRNVVVVATPAKLASTPVLRVDTGDPRVDDEIRKREYLFVVIGYRTSKIHPVQG
ncbi:MAG TPA: ATP-NAD kinase family protein [Thermoplasmata archaeon]|nr:ATP-NAD kinase family protein [Thermoplasmata archaeon]